ncbi:hypothetical protein BgiBS90_019562 [Biomphalaria glabrata]|nr:hypothetical protein BgiBS90_019562 [Biomphalaria glabrata]
MVCLFGCLSLICIQDSPSGWGELRLRCAGSQLLVRCGWADTSVMKMGMPRGGLTPVVGADRSWDFSLEECSQFWSRVMSDSPSTGMCEELRRSTFRQQNTPALM